MVNFMLKRNGQYPIPFDLNFHPFGRPSPGTDFFFPFHILQAIWDTQASFLMVNFPFFRNNFGVYQGEEVVLGVNWTDIKNDPPSGNSNLTSGQTNPPS